jgi:hypothetical protein
MVIFDLGKYIRRATPSQTDVIKAIKFLKYRKVEENLHT